MKDDAMKPCDMCENMDEWGKEGADSISLGALMEDNSEEDREETLEFVAHAGLHRATHLAS